MPMKSSKVRSVILFVLAVLSIPFRAQGDVETLLTELNRKPAEERLRILMEREKNVCCPFMARLQ
jgi:hypothetical protein